MRLLAAALVSLALAPACRAQDGGSYAVSISTGEPAGTLVVVTTVTWGGDRPIVRKRTWSPTVHDYFVLQDGAFLPEKGGWKRFYEAFPRPKSKGYLLLRVYSDSVSSTIEEMTLVDPDESRIGVSLPKLAPAAVYWANNGQKLMILDPRRGAVSRVYVYDSSTGLKIDEISRGRFDPWGLKLVVSH